jgi:hypothetical protein
MVVHKWNFNLEYNNPHLCDHKPVYFHTSGRCCNKERTCTMNKDLVNCEECLKIMQTMPLSEINDLIQAFVDKALKL